MSPRAPFERGHAAVAIFAKAPLPGRVKTRLVPPLTPEEAAGVARACLEDTLRRFPPNVPAAWTLFLEGEADPALRRRAERAGVALLPQGAGDLGERLERAFALLRGGGAEIVAAVGADSPTLPPERIAQALGELRRHDVVLGPAEDGGYYLIGLSRDPGDYFRNTPWGTERVARVAEERAVARRFTLARLAPWFDVDDVASLRRAAETAKAGECPALVAMIGRIDPALLAGPRP